ncbi:MAG: PKD domain-containing protein, partial [Flavobacteriales bacterium]|nr:PKD domain-containing protein [Flavobacteriales bacterium]
MLVAAQPSIFLEDFEGGGLGPFTNSNLQNSLQWVNTNIRGIDPGHSNTQSAYFGNPADTTFKTGFIEGAQMTSTAIDLSTYTNVKLSFNYFLETENANGYDIAQVQMSTNGITFSEVANNQLSIGNLDDGLGTWRYLELDVSSYAGNSTVYIRIAFNTVDAGANNYEGFYIDDIRLFDPNLIDFNMSPPVGCAPLTITFNNMTTQPGAMTYQWYWGDGTPMFQENFSTTLNHTFLNNGTYSVKMEVYNSFMVLLGSMTKTVTVNGISSWDQLYLWPEIACPGEDIGFNAPWGFSQYIFNKGDGSPADTTLNSWNNYQYSTPGTYVASVEIQNVCGGKDTIMTDTVTINSTMPFPIWVNIGSSNANACPSDNISFWGPWGFASYEWDYGDGNSLITTNANVNHQYATEGLFTVTCRVYNYCGDDTLLSMIQQVKYPPFPPMSLFINSTPACPGASVYLSAPWGYTEYVWDFGDGSPLDSTMDASQTHDYDSLGSYIASVTITQFCGNDTTISGTVNINSYVPFESFANLYTSPDPACPFESIYLSGLWGYDDYVWNFGDGSPMENTTTAYTNHVYTAQGDYPAAVTITNLCGNDTTLIDTVHIDNTLPFPPSISYYLSANPSCPGGVDFNASGGYQFYTWDFGDGGALETTTTNTTSHSYPNLGTYPISLKLVNYCGADTTLYDTLEIEYTPWPSLYLNYNPTTACPNEKVNFNASWGYVSYDWDFGDGTTFTGSNYTGHKYANVGVYIVSVTINQLCGNDTTLTDTVRIVNNQVIPSWVSVYANPDPACPTKDIDIGGPWGFASYFWDFGDGGVDTTTDSYLQYQYDSAGDYQVALTVTNFCGLDTTIYDSIEIDDNLAIESWVSLYVYYQTGMSACPGEFVNMNGPWGYPSYVWDYGDGTPTDSGSFQVMNHAYADAGTYTVSLTVGNACGNDTTLYQLVNVDDNKPFGMVSLWASMAPVCPGADMSFTATGGYKSYIWNFGDGTALDSTNSPIITRSFAGGGTYVVEVKIIDYCGKDTTTSVMVTIDDDMGIWAWVDMYPNPICPNQEAIFSTDTNHVSYFWDFGDGFSAYGPNETNHSYSALGDYDVSVTITNHCGNDSTFESTITVDTTTSFPSWLGFWGDPWQICPGEIMTLVTEEGFNNYFWDFGDGDTVTTFGASIGHVYGAAGNYDASVTITNGCGNSTTLTSTMNVSTSTNVFTPLIKTAANAYCPGDQVNFLLSSWSGGEENYTYVWDYDDGNIDTTIGVGATHIYDSVGTYSTAVTVVNACGNSEMVIVPVTIINNATPNLNSNIFGTLASTTIAGCAGDAILFYFQGSSTNLWDFGDGSTGDATEEFMDEDGITMTVIKHAYSTEGTYVVKLTLTNSCGNSTTDSLTIQISDDFLVDGGLILEPPAITGSYTTCSNINMIAFGGSSYEWDFGDGNTLTTISPTISHVFSDAGNYSISVSITNGCGNSTTFSDAVNITSSGGISPNISVASSVTCFEGSDGSVMATPSGGLSPYMYQWDDDNTQTTATASGLSAGTYTVSIIDDMGCISDTSIFLGEADEISISTTSTDATCGSSNGTATCFVDSGGVSPFSYAWASGGTSTTETGLSSGSNVVTITDGDGCSNTAIASVSDIGGPTLSM